jgi:phosphoribosyl 1,2-cyclic phosphate phosphodiesterase
MRFYGTSAAEGIPNPFCSCPVCRNARQTGGAEVRRRSTFRVNERISLDLGADSFQQAIDYGDFTELAHVLVSHTHEDHFNYLMMNVRNMAIERHKEPLHFYLTDRAYDIADFYRQSQPIMKGMTTRLEEQGVIAFRKLEFNRTAIVDGMEVTPLRGNHRGNMGEDCANYLLRLQDGRKLYYGVDTGWYLPETFRALENAALDVLISECTFGLTPGRGPHPGGHLDAPSCMGLFRQLLEQGTLHEGTHIYLTHINHFTSTHAELVEWFAAQHFPCRITVAYDGLRI